MADHSMNSWLEELLDAEQHKAVVAPERAVAVLAGAGSGKTRAFALRVAYLVNHCGVPRERILALTFTNKAADEMAGRVEDLVGAGAGGGFAYSGGGNRRWGDGVHCGTFHGFCAHLLRRYASFAGLSPDFVIYDETDSKSLINTIAREHSLDGRSLAGDLYGWISRCKDTLREMDQSPIYSSNIQHEAAVELAAVYQRRLRESNACDFADLILHVLSIAHREPGVARELSSLYQHILVDEYQDTNRVQQELLRVMAGEQAGLWVVGDEDQSIYGWRGADVKSMARFLQEYDGAKLYPLQQNYRSCGNILQAANSIISVNPRRIGKTLFPVRDAGLPLEVLEAYDGRSEAEMVVDRIADILGEEVLPDVGVLYRTNSQSRPFEEQLSRRGIPFVMLGGVRFYERSEVKDLISYARLVINPLDEVALRRVINLPRRGVGKVAMGAILDLGGGRGLGAGLQRLGEGVQSPGLAGRSLQGVMGFLRLLEDLREECRTRDAAASLVTIYARSGLQQWYEGKGEQERMDNLRELLNGAAEACIKEPGLSLARYLEELILASAADVEGNTARVNLLTVHCSKGLEFNDVFLTGFEDGLFPLLRENMEEGAEEAALDEERRLAYVAFTRARNRLFLSHASWRFRNGVVRESRPSRFLGEIPVELVSERIAQVSYGGGLARTGLGRPFRQELQVAPSGFTEDDFHNLPDYPLDDLEEVALEPMERVFHPVHGEGTLLEPPRPSGKVRVEFSLGVRRVRIYDLEKAP